MPHVLPALPYKPDALEPHLDARTVEIHHDKHHATYVNNLNAALEKHPELFNKSIEDLLANLKNVPEDIRTTVRNNGGGVLNHNLYWETMGPGGGGKPSGKLAQAIDQIFGGFDAFKEKFSKTAVGQFASGWGWLYLDSSGKLNIASTPGHDTPLMKGTVSCEGKPLLVVDVWEHAYYLKFQNRRPDFVSTWWNVVNWKKVEELYSAAT
jgi:Fe-Mn family superoxide dismutase